MGAPKSRLTRFQAELLEAFFRQEGRFFLTGGGALAGYHLGHRGTHDLDLFTLSPVMEDGVRALRAAAKETGASWQDVQTAPELRRVLLSRGNESVIVDLVVEHTEQLRPAKPLHGIQPGHRIELATFLHQPFRQSQQNRFAGQLDRFR